MSTTLRHLWKACILASLVTLISCGDEESWNEEVIEDDFVGSAEYEAISVPAGFQLSQSWTGIKVYRKDWDPGEPDYVTVVDLRRARIANLVTGLRNAGDCGTGERKALGPGANSFWTQAGDYNTATSPVRVVLNGTYFSTAQSPTGLAFGLKVYGTLVSKGYGIAGNGCGARSEYPGNERLFSFSSSNSRAWIENYSTATFGSSTKRDVVGALATTCCKSPDSYTGRTVVGVRDDDVDGTYETIMFFSSKSARLSGEHGADATLQRFGATIRANLDGGSSTGLVVNGVATVPVSRSLPHAIAIYAGR